MWLRLLLLFLVHSSLVRGQGGDGRDRVAGGEEAPRGRFPYMCSLRKRGFREHLCGGALIGPQWVLTAAHCVDPNRQGSVGTSPIIFCGIHDVEDDSEELTYRAEDTKIHPSWTGSTTDGYDIALIKLTRSASAELPEVAGSQSTLDSNALLTVVGWGETPEGPSALTLQFASRLNLVTFETCNTFWGDDLKEDLMICAGIGTRDACGGDSGGPLLLADTPRGQIARGKARLDLIVGITSFGGRECGKSQQPGVYTSVSYFREWIVSTIGQTKTVPTSPADVQSQCKATPALLPDAIVAISSNDVAALQSALSCGLSPDARYNDPNIDQRAMNGALLHWAVRLFCAECVQVLVDNGADLEIKNGFGETPLHEGAAYSSIEAAQVLVDNGAELNPRAPNSDTPLQYAAFFGNSNFLLFLIENGADVNVVGRSRMTPLHDAASLGHTYAAEILLENGVSIDPVDNSGSTPLHLAVSFGQLEVAEVLLEAGASKTIKNDRGDTPEDAICKEANPACTEETKSAIEALFSA